MKWLSRGWILVALLLLGLVGYYFYLDRTSRTAGQLLEGAKALKARDWESADAHFSEAIQGALPFWSDKAKAYIWRGVSRSELKKYDEAIADFNEAIRLDPNNAMAYRNRGATHGRKGELEQALTDLGEAIRLDPNDPLAPYDRGVVYYKKGEYDLAIADLGEAIRLKPNDAKAYWARGRAFAKKGDADQSKRDQQRAVDLDAAVGQAGEAGQ
jgi:tetratricopeptide (TPR) repeat protein